MITNMNDINVTSLLLENRRQEKKFVEITQPLLCCRPVPAESSEYHGRADGSYLMANLLEPSFH